MSWFCWRCWLLRLRFRFIEPGAKVVPRMKIRHRVYNAIPLAIRRRFWI